MMPELPSGTVTFLFTGEEVLYHVKKLPGVVQRHPVARLGERHKARPGIDRRHLDRALRCE
jgi:hypothetical protein